MFSIIILARLCVPRTNKNCAITSVCQNSLWIVFWVPLSRNKLLIVIWPFLLATRLESLFWREGAGRVRFRRKVTDSDAIFSHFIYRNVFCFLYENFLFSSENFINYLNFLEPLSHQNYYFGHSDYYIWRDNIWWYDWCQVDSIDSKHSFKQMSFIIYLHCCTQRYFYI